MAASFFGMNPKDYMINLTIEEPELEEVLLSIFHTIILHRTFPTLSFRGGVVSYTSCIGTEDVDCKNFDVTYVRVTSKALHEKVSEPVLSFSKLLSEELQTSPSGIAKGSISLAFVTNRKGSWVLGADSFPWERWTINIELQLPRKAESEEYRRKLSSQLQGELLYVLDCINTPENYLPELGSSQADCESLIDFSMPEISPYRFKIAYNTGTRPTMSGKPLGVRRF